MHTSMKISHPHSLADGGEKRPRADPGRSGLRTTSLLMKRTLISWDIEQLSYRSM